MKKNQCARRWMQAAVMALAGVVSGSQAHAAAGAIPLKVPFHHQETNGCGPASIEMVEMYWSARRAGVSQPSQSEFHTTLPVTNQGTLLLDMRQYLVSEGYYAFTIQGDAADLGRQVSKGRAPIVALKVNPNADLHYVVVTGLDQHKVWLNDPAKRRPGSINRKKFEKRWTDGGSWMLLAVPRETK